MADGSLSGDTKKSVKDRSMKANIETLVKVSDKMFSDVMIVNTLRQELSEQFYPERADFTYIRSDGVEFARNLFESIPTQNRRDLAAAMGAILRPRGRDWFRVKSKIDRLNTDKVLAFFDRAGSAMRTYIYSAKAQFQRAMKQADNDFVTFGNSVTSITLNAANDGLLFKTYHLRDCAWAEDASGEVNRLDRKSKYTLAQFVETFGSENLPSSKSRNWEKTPEDKVEVRVVTMPVDMVPGRPVASINKRHKFVTLYIEPVDKRIIKTQFYVKFPYLVRRWELTTESVYANSPASMTALPDARLLQSQAQILLEAGERVADPPLIAVRDALVEGANVFPGGISWVDGDFDEGRQGQALRPLETGANLPIGLEMKKDTREVLGASWYINKLALPMESEMTATEVNERIDEYIRSAGPVFEPFEADNARLLDMVFELMFDMGAFGGRNDIPPELLGSEVHFEMDTPIQMAFEKKKVQEANQIKELAEGLAQVSPDVVDNWDWDRIGRDCSQAIALHDGWLRQPDDVAEIRQQKQQQAQQQQAAAQIAMIHQGANAAQAAMPVIQNAKSMMQGKPIDTSGKGGGAAPQMPVPQAPVPSGPAPMLGTQRGYTGIPTPMKQAA